MQSMIAQRTLSGSSQSPRSPSAQPFLSVSVTDPVKLGNGVQAYISYRVITKTNFPEYQGQEKIVIRRYSDFVWLRDRLAEKYKGIFIPPLPEKSAVEKFRFSAEFIEMRRQALDIFVNRIASHPQLQQSEDLRTFLQADEENMERARSQETSIFKKKPADLMQIFKDVQSKVSDVVLGKEKPVEESDPEYEKLKHYIFELEEHLAEAQKQSFRLVKRHRGGNPKTKFFDFVADSPVVSPRGMLSSSSGDPDFCHHSLVSGNGDHGLAENKYHPKGLCRHLSNGSLGDGGSGGVYLSGKDKNILGNYHFHGYFVYSHFPAMAITVFRKMELGQSLSDFGKAVKLLGACEGASLGKAFSELGSKSEMLSIKLQEEAHNLLMTFEEPLKDYVRAVQSIKATMADRANAFRQQCELAETTKLKELHLEKLMLMRSDRVAEAEIEYKELKAESEEATIRFETIVRLMSEEVVRFQEQKTCDMVLAFHGFAEGQAQLANEIADAWRSLLPKLEACSPSHT